MSHFLRPIPSPSHRAFTLLETVCSITVLAVVSASVLPVVNGAIDTHSQSVLTRRQADSAAYAMERSIRLLRDVPKGTSVGSVGISSAALSSITFTDGRSLSLSGTNLSLTDGIRTSVLCRSVSAFEITYLGENGTTNTLSTPLSTRRFNVRLVVGNIEYRSSAFARVWMVR